MPSTPSPFDFRGRVVLVTGGSRGLGRAMALGFADQGAQLIIVSRKEQSCRQVADEITAGGGSAVALPGHVGDWASLDGLMEAAVQAFGRLDVLVNNAGIAPVAESSAAMGRRCSTRSWRSI